MNQSALISPSQRIKRNALALSVSLPCLMAGVMMQPNAAKADVIGPATLAPGTFYDAPPGTSFELDFTAMLTDFRMADGNYWQFNVSQKKASAKLTGLKWEVQYNNSGTWVGVDWDQLDPMGATTTTTVPGLDLSNNFPGSTSSIDVTLPAPLTSLVSAYLPKSNFPTVTDVKIVGTVDASTPNGYLSEIAVSDISWDGTTQNAPVFNNAYSASLTSEKAPAPGPLPLLGAGAAFGFSRRLRSRIKAPRFAMSGSAQS